MGKTFRQVGNPYFVAVGQTYADVDPRMQGRTIVVEAIDGAYARVRSSYSGKLTRIHLARFRPSSTGYRLVVAVAGETTLQEGA